MNTTTTPSDIRTTYNSPALKHAEVTLPDGRVYSVYGERYRGGLTGRRAYYWSFRLHGPGIAHAATPSERIQEKVWRHYDLGAEFSRLDCIRTSAQNLTEAKRRLAALLSN